MIRGERVDLQIDLDRNRPLATTHDVGHTRWHPDIAPIATINPGDVVQADVRDGGDRQMATDPSGKSDINRLHPLTGPFYVRGAEPGDLITVELLAVEPDEFGWTAIRRRGKGLMRDAVPDDFVTVWQIRDGVARSPDLPGITIKGIPFLGIVGVAPSRARMEAVNKREQSVNSAGGWALTAASEGSWPPGVEDGLRTMAPREIGGNLDIKDVAAGAHITLPVDVPGALLSIGDPHFNQGDGESFGTAIEMCARVHFRCRLRKADAIRWRPRFPYVEITAEAPTRKPRAEFIAVGMSIDEEGHEHYMDVSLATQQALKELTGYLVEERDYTTGQAQAIVSVAADLRISVVNNPPTIVVCAALPLDIFESRAARA